MAQREVRLGMLGSGFASRLHLNGIKRVYGAQSSYAACVTEEPNENVVKAFQQEFKIPTRYATLDEMLKDVSIDAVSICTPTTAHPQQICAILNAGKHVICEKPLLGYCGSDPNAENFGREASRVQMFDTVCEQLAKIDEIVSNSSAKFLYAENWIYSPSILRANEILGELNSQILTLRGDAKLSGSHTPDAARWARTGGGVLMRIGCHAISALLFLKSQECKRAGKAFGIRAVLCDTATLTEGLDQARRRYIQAYPKDVEDWAQLIIEFTDGTRGVVSTADTVLGGLRFGVGIEADNLQLYCNLDSANQLNGFVPAADIANDIYVKEKVETSAGFQTFNINDDITRGYLGEMQDLVECILNDDKKPLSDFRIASDTTKIVYAGYLSAEKNAKVYL